MRPSLLHLALFTPLFAACSITPVAPIPRPLPEALEWASAGEKAPRAFLGLKTRENIGGGFDDLEFRAGIKVTRVVENSPAAEAGMGVGDVLLKWNEVDLDDPETLEALIAKAEANAKVRLEVQRDDTVFGLSLSLGEAVGSSDSEEALSAEPSYRLDPSRSRAAWLSGHGGVVLVASHAAAPFPLAGIPVGSVVHAIDGLTMHSDRALIRHLQALDPGQRVEVSFSDPAGKAHSKPVRLQTQPRRLTEFSIPLLCTYRARAEGDQASLVVLDLWFISLFRYSREGTERKLSVLRFLSFQSGIGELGE